MKDKGLRPWLPVIAGGASLVSRAGATLLVETARRSGLAKELSTRLGRWRKPLATHDLGKTGGCTRRLWHGSLARWARDRWTVRGSVSKTRTTASSCGSVGNRNRRAD